MMRTGVSERAGEEKLHSDLMTEPAEEFRNAMLGTQERITS